MGEILCSTLWLAPFLLLIGGLQWIGTRKQWDRSLLLPVQLWLAVVAITLFLEGAFPSIDPCLLSKVRQTGAVIAFTWLFLSWRRLFVQREKKRGFFDPIALELFGQVAVALISFFALLLLMSLLGLDTAPLLTLGGVGAAAIGIASKEFLSNFFGGVLLSLHRPFTLGDRIELPEKGIEGVVEEVHWYFTKLQGEGGKEIHLPNSLFSTCHVVNHKRGGG